MKVGEYVRTKNGEIGKLVNVEVYYVLWQNDKDKFSCVLFNNSYVPCIVSNDFIIKKGQLIDLIEVGDYVNGYRVSCISCVTKTIYTDDINIYFKKEEIKDNKSIVTKEQFESMEYKKEEVKEILEKIKSVSNFDDYVDFVGTEFKPLLEHITNLREELNATLKNYGNLVKEWKILQKENERLRKDYGRLMQDNAYTLELEQRNEKAINDLDILIEIIYQQPTENKEDDMWLLDRLSGIKLELQGEDNK